MLISLHGYPRVDRVTAFLLVLAVGFLPSLAETGACQERSPVTLPQEVFSDGDKRISSEPLNEFDFLQNDARIHQLGSSLETFARSAPDRKDFAVQVASCAALYCLTSRLPPYPR